MTHCNQNCGWLTKLNIRRIAKEIYITENHCDECLDETLGKEIAGAEHSCRMMFKVILNLDEALRNLGMGYLIDTDEYCLMYLMVEDQLKKWKIGS